MNELSSKAEAKVIKANAKETNPNALRAKFELRDVYTQ